MLGFYELFSGKPALFTIKSATHSLIYSISYDDFINITFDSPIDKEAYHYL